MPLLVGLAALACAKQVHPIHLTSVYTYEPPAARASVAVGADGTLEEHNLRLAQGGTEPSFVQTHSLLHGKQLAKLREHHKDVRSRTEQRSVAALEGHLVEQHSAHARRSWDVNVNGVIPLTNLRDSQYVGPIGVGSSKKGNGRPQSLISVVFDTGSTNLWISSSLCTTEDCQSRAAFNPQRSTTYTTPDVPVHLDITFGTGELRGPQGIDYFRVGPYTVQNQTFGLIQEEVGEVFHEIPFEGILGLAFPSMSAHGVQPFFDTVMQQNVLNGHNEISFFMTKMPHTGSAVFFGGVDDRFFDGEINYFPVNQQHYWSCDLIDFKIGDTSHTNFLEFKNEGPRVSKLILDSGTTYFTAPPGLFQKVMDRLPSTQCSEVDKYPPLHYIMKDVDGKVHDIEIPPHVYMVSTYDDGWCDLSFMEIPVPEQYGPAFIFGEVFMREWYTVFNRGSGQAGSAMVGFAHAKPPSKTLQMALAETNELDAW